MTETTGPKCRVIKADTKQMCGEPAVGEVTFKDEDRTTACQDCALSLEQTALAHGSSVAFESFAAKERKRKRCESK